MKQRIFHPQSTCPCLLSGKWGEKKWRSGELHFLAAAVVRGWGRKETENLSNSPQYHAFHNVHSHAPLAFEEMTQFFQPPEDDSESYCSERGNHPEVRVRWTEHALFCLSHNRRTRVYKVSFPNFQWITNVPWKHLAALPNNWDAHISRHCTRISAGVLRIGSSVSADI